MHDNVKTIYTHIYYINKYVTYIYIYGSIPSKKKIIILIAPFLVVILF